MAPATLPPPLRRQPDPSFALGRGNYSEFRRERQADGPACVLAVGTANPANCIKQDKYTDWYYHLTKSDHLTDMKGVMKRICEMTGIKKRYMQILNEDLFRENVKFLDPAAPSLPARLGVVAAAMPGLAAAAASKAFAEWGRPAGDITHLVFSTSTSAQVPAVDLRIASLLGLSPDVQRTTISFHACTGTSSALRVAKDIAENNLMARVLVICADMLTVVGFHVPDERPVGIIAHALFSDGAGAIIVGAGPQGPVERPIFEMVSTCQVTVPGTEYVATNEFTAGGMGYSLLPDELAALIDRNIERCLVGALAPLGIDRLGWNNLFWAVHPGGPMIMDSVEAVLKLEPGKLSASRRVLSEYGNTTGPTLIFVLDELSRRRRRQDGEEEWGVMVGFGPGFTVEVMALHAPSHLLTIKSKQGRKSSL